MNLLNLLFPRRCVSCGKLGKYFCPKCRSDIQFIEENRLICPVCEKPAISGAIHPRCRTGYTIDGLTSFFRYTGPIRQAVKLIKYRFVSDLAQELISLIPNTHFQFLIHNSKFLILIPVPLHPSRFRFRGFNQSEILGGLLAKKLNIPIDAEILKRTRKTTPQVEMKDRKKRLANMEEVFEVNNITMKQCNPSTSLRTDNLTILLFDDVFTTGATLRSAANVLKRNGFKTVWGVTLAHG